MTFFALLIGLAIDRLWTSVTAMRSYRWFTQYCARLRQYLGAAHWSDGPLGLLLILLFPLLTVALVQLALTEVSGLLGFLFAVAVLVYSLGPRDLDKDVQRYLNARDRGDVQDAWAAAREINGELTLPADPAALDLPVIEGILVAGHERVLSVMFWFVVLGPVGALLFRLTSHLKTQCRGEEPHSGFTRAVELFQAVLAWLPSRLTALGYALVGSFADALFRWREEAAPATGDLPADNRTVLVASGLGALQLEHDDSVDLPAYSHLEVRAALAMVWRTVILALVLIAIGTFGSWLF